MHILVIGAGGMIGTKLGGADFGFKGAGLAEILGAALTRMRLSIEQEGTALGHSGLGHLVIAIDPATFMSLDRFAERIATYLRGFADQPGTYAAGGLEWEQRRRRETGGIPLSERLHSELKMAADLAGISLPW